MMFQEEGIDNDGILFLMVQLHNLCNVIGVPLRLMACLFLQDCDKAATPSGGALAARPELQVQFLPALTPSMLHTQVLLAPVSAINQHFYTMVLQVPNHECLLVHAAFASCFHGAACCPATTCNGNPVGVLCHGCASGCMLQS
jgi:hypothetical protein